MVVSFSIKFQAKLYEIVLTGVQHKFHISGNISFEGIKKVQIGAKLCLIFDYH